jgi:hypothetical protein
VVFERQQPALVACHQIIGPARCGQSQQKIVGGIARAANLRQRVHTLGQFCYFVYQTTSFVGFDTFGDRGLAQRGAQFVEMFSASQQREVSLSPSAIDRGGISSRNHEGRDQNVGIEHCAHQAFLALLLA